ncbi:MAG: hypothetical protein JSV86_04720 [Gemmatimonadota bacterium]|nr:MAG: hypothetical protein JSV86_04720 [Gemmatimonadota bacterium]
MADRANERGSGARRTRWAARVGPTVKFAFGAGFTSVRTIPLRAGRSERLTVTDVLAAASGRLWIADAVAKALKIYSPQGWCLGTLDREATGLRRPVSLAPLHGRWIAALDGLLPAVAVLDEAGRPLRRFRLHEVDRPVQVCSLNDRKLAVLGSGWGRGSGKLVHLYTTGGEYIESFFGEPREPQCDGRAYAATMGEMLYLAHSRTDSFAVYDLDAGAVLSFPSVTARIAARAGRDAGFAGDLRGLFAMRCGPLLAAYTRDAGDYLYDLYAADGTPIALGLPSGERVVGVEGPFFYSVHGAPGGDTTLRVWKLGLEGDGGALG